MFIVNRKNGAKMPSFGYRKWRDQSGPCLVKQWKALGSIEPPMKRPWQIDILINVNRRSDIDNREKALLDLLVRCLPFPDDAWCDRVTIERSDKVDGCRVTVSNFIELLI
jgi:Holliday junction resolvase RusA-like endonuclease